MDEAKVCHRAQIQPRQQPRGSQVTQKLYIYIIIQGDLWGPLILCLVLSLYVYLIYIAYWV